MSLASRVFGGALLCLLATQVAAKDSAFWIARAEGEIVIGPEGQVHSVALASGLDGALRASVERRVSAWRFEPIVENGRAVNARARLTLQLRAVETDSGDMQVSIAEAFFPRSATEQEQAAAMVLHKERINYPKRALRESVGGEVVLAVELDADGVPGRIAAQSGWLYGSDWAANRAEHWMQMLADEAARSVRQWRFAGRDVIGSEVVLVPVTFQVGNAAWHRAHWVELPQPEWRHAQDTRLATRLSAEGEAAAEGIRLLSPLDAPAQGS